VGAQITRVNTVYTIYLFIYYFLGDGSLTLKVNCKDGVTFTHFSRYVAYNFEPIEPIDVLLSVLSVRVIGVNKILTPVTNQKKYPRCCIYFFN
jgi:hypothetical protein